MFEDLRKQKGEKDLAKELERVDKEERKETMPPIPPIFIIWRKTLYTKMNS